MLNLYIPKTLKILCYSNSSLLTIKFISKIGIIKKTIKNKSFEVSYDLNHRILVLKSCTSKKYSLNTIAIYRIILKQLILNIFKPFQDRLVLEGIGYKVWKKKNILKFKLGFSKSFFIKIPKGISVSTYKFRKITISSLSLQYLRIFKQDLRLLKVPDSYKKKGVRFYKEILKLKEGKKTR